MSPAGDDFETETDDFIALPFGPTAVVRRAFLQSLEDGGGAAPLSRFVKARRPLALDLFVVAIAAQRQAWGAPITASSDAWLRATGRPATRAMAASVTRAWNWLEQQELVRSARHRGRRVIEVLREDGSGREWTYPEGIDNPSGEGDPAFVVPQEYVDVAMFRPISLAAKAILLIALSLQPDGDGEAYFELPVDRGAAWYGLPPSTVRAGLKELRDLQMIYTWVEKVPSQNSPIGWRYDRRHRLLDLYYAAWRLNHPRDHQEPARPAPSP
jgi:hypothetical protein